MTAFSTFARTPLRLLALRLAPVLLLVLTAVGPGDLSGRAFAEDPTSEARNFLKTFSDQAVATLADSGLGVDEREAALRALINSGFEIDTIGRLALGRHWKAATDSQRTEFRTLFESYVTTTTIKRLSGYSGEVLELGNARAADTADLVMVASRIRSPAGSTIALEWRLRRSGEAGWRIIDVVVEGVSMLQTHRAEFDAVIRNNGAGVEGLLHKLRSIVQA